MKLLAEIKTLYSKFVGWLGLNKQQDIDRPEELKKTGPRKRKNHLDTAVDGDYRNAKDLFDDLDDRYEFLKDFKPRTTQSGLRLIKRIGVYMSRDSCYEKGTIFNVKQMEGGKDRPYPAAFAEASQNRSDDPDIVTGVDQLSWAEKMKWSHRTFYVEKPTNGWLYMYGMVLRWAKNDYCVVEVPIEIDTEKGEARLLKSYQTSRVPLPSGTHYTKKSWEIPTFGFGSYLDEMKGDVSKEALQRYALHNFVLAYNRYLRREASTQIHATKNGQRMIFTVPMHTWKDFFKDRLTAIASDGKRKRIFHHVAAHVRSNGQKVPMHTRGVTRFKWNGFNIKICELKKGRLSSTDIQSCSEVLTDDEHDEARRKGKRYLTADELGIRITRAATRDLHKPTAQH